ncbi:anthocyanidin 3-O-glucosyltransferase 7-like protein [Carex littledalei]|uniref:Glycosyltransferase n=1 Tax=Carex littledalei TaxID=544730 RepID=A0A833QZI8_9POAL|nr:anthocyanidin 3-O-glucosyltransferase 7-like protein [Carex littledalei]
MTQSHVAIVAFPFSSHAGSLFSLARAMAALSPSSHFSFLSTKRSLSSFNSQQLLQNISLVPISDGITTPQARHHIEAIELFLKSFKESLREGLKAAELAQDCKVRCIVSDAFVWLTGDVADEMAVNWVPVRTGSPLDLYARLNADLIKEIVAVRSYGDNLLSFLPCLSNHRATDLPYGLNTGDPNFVYHLICDQMARKLPESDILVTNTIQGLECNLDSYFKQNFTNYFPVGPFHLLNPSQKEPPTDSYGCLSWLDRHEPATVAYVSLGTIAFLCPSELTSLANGLEASGVPFLWSLKEETQSHLPSGFIDRMNETGKGKIVPWTPQTSVLKHSAVGAFVSHCGWNSVLESIVGGVPLVCRPFFGDQTINTRLVSYVWKVGVAMDAGVFTEETVVRAFDVIFKRDEGKKMKSKMNELKDMVIAAVEENGSSKENLKRLMKIVCGS